MSFWDGQGRNRIGKTKNLKGGLLSIEFLEGACSKHIFSGRVVKGFIELLQIVGLISCHQGFIELLQNSGIDF